MNTLHGIEEVGIAKWPSVSLAEAADAIHSRPPAPSGAVERPQDATPSRDEPSAPASARRG